MARSFVVLLLAGTALAGCASAPPPQVVYVERPYPAPPPRYMGAPYAAPAPGCAAHGMRPPRTPAQPQFRDHRMPQSEAPLRAHRPMPPAHGPPSPHTEPQFRAQRPPHGSPLAHVQHGRPPASRRPQIAKR